MSEDALAGRLTEGGHVLRQRVYFEDTDFSGLIYHARYLHFMERGRSDFLRLLGIHHSELAREGLAFAVRHMEIDFRMPGRIDDMLDIVTSPFRIGGARLVLDQAVIRAADILASARVTVALVDASGRAARLPAGLREAVSQYGGERGGRSGEA